MINQRNALHHHIFCYINYYTYIYLYSYSWIYCKPKTYNLNKNSLYTVNIFSSHVGIIIIILFHVTSGVFFLKSRLSSTNFFLEVSDSSWRSASSVAVTSNDFYEGYRKKTMRRMIVWIDFIYNGCFLYIRQFALSRPGILGFTHKTKEYKQSKRWLLPVVSENNYQYLKTV